MEVMWSERSDFDMWFGELQQIAFFSYGVPIPTEEKEKYLEPFTLGSDATNTIITCQEKGLFN